MKYIIADLKTEYDAKYPMLKERSKAYESDFDDEERDFLIKLKEGFIERQLEIYKELTIEQHEYMWIGEGFYRNLLLHNGFLLHSSCVEKDGYAYLFSAKSGTGKSTHTHLWLKNLENTRIINDDKPALRFMDGKWYAYGTPFSGKTDENLNVRVPVRAVIFIERGEKNIVKRMPLNEAIGKFLNQTVRPYSNESANYLLENLDLLLRSVPVLSLTCNMDDDAAITSYNEIERLCKNED